MGLCLELSAIEFGLDCLSHLLNGVIQFFALLLSHLRIILAISDVLDLFIIHDGLLRDFLGRLQHPLDFADNPLLHLVMLLLCLGQDFVDHADVGVAGEAFTLRV